MSADLSWVVGASLTAAQDQVVNFSEGTMTATVTVTRRNAPGALNYTTGLVDDVPTVVYSGKARIGQVRGGSQMDIGGEVQFFSQVSVSIPLSAPLVKIDDMVSIDAAVDPHVVGRLFRVTDTEGGGDIPADQTFNALGVAPSRTNT